MALSWGRTLYELVDSCLWLMTEKFLMWYFIIVYVCMILTYYITFRVYVVSRIHVRYPDFSFVCWNCWSGYFPLPFVWGRKDEKEDWWWRDGPQNHYIFILYFLQGGMVPLLHFILGTTLWGRPGWIIVTGPKSSFWVSRLRKDLSMGLPSCSLTLSSLHCR